MKNLIIGCDGQLGTEFIDNANKYNYQVIGLTHEDIDVSDEILLKKVLDGYELDVIINTAAYHGNKAYMDENPQKHFNVNSFGPLYLARYCEKREITLVHFSTDYVFTGNESQSSYYFNENDTPIPTNLYGASKLAGETLIQSIPGKNIIFRLASLFGHKGCKAKGYDNFVEMIIRKYEKNQKIQVVNDIYMTPTSTELAVNTTLDLLNSNHLGLFHLVSNNNCSWYEYALEIFNLMGFNKDKIEKVTSLEKEGIIDHGNNTSLNNQKLKHLGIKIHHWKYYLSKYINRRKGIDTNGI